MSFLLSNIYHSWQERHKQNAVRKTYLQLYKKIFALHPELNTHEAQEYAWLNKWQTYDSSVSKASYRIFSKFIGEDINIIPLETCANLVEPQLNPKEYIEFYADKNSLHLFLPHSFMPNVVLRNISGYFYNNDYQIVNDDIDSVLANLQPAKLILKPSRECSGKGVQLITKTDGKYITSNDDVISAAYLASHYGKDYLLQECVKQSTYLAQFNPTSVNTIRLFTYRDIHGTIVPMRSILRIGGKGANVDNAHSGGLFCGIDEQGHLGKFCCSWLGDRVDTFNDIDFANGDFTIPNYDKIKMFGVEIAKRIPHHDLIAMDIALDESNNPTLLEINVGGFSAWLFQFTIGSTFGNYTDEIMQRCTKKC